MMVTVLLPVEARMKALNSFVERIITEFSEIRNC